jgi:hypothetical protein
MGYTEKLGLAPEIREPFDWVGVGTCSEFNGNSGISAGSLSCPALSLEFGGGVFQGTTISLTGSPSPDSLALNLTFRLTTGICSPLSVKRLIRAVGIVTVPDIWNRLPRKHFSSGRTSRQSPD